MKLHNLATPCLLIDQDKMQKNIARMAEHISGLGCHLRPHVKTHKSVGITEQIVAGGAVRGITVSTLKEAEHFFAHGFSDILYAVGIAPVKFAQVHALRKQGCALTIILDSLEAANLLIEYAHVHECDFEVLIELDVDNHRAGVNPKNAELVQIAQTLHACPNIDLRGVMTHAGASYDCPSLDEQRAIAKQERDLSLLAARQLREYNIPCPVVSIGSTPTALAIDNLEGITEVRAGVYVLFDLVMAGLGVCHINDIAISVLGSVIGAQKHKEIVLSDAGWMAMSRDRGTQEQAIDYGYGAICNLNGQVLSDLSLQGANQEHGIIAVKNKGALKNKSHSQAKALLDELKIGDLIRVLPNHACATAAQYDSYYLVSGDKVIKKLSTLVGW